MTPPGWGARIGTSRRRARGLSRRGPRGSARDGILRAASRAGVRFGSSTTRGEGGGALGGSGARDRRARDRADDWRDADSSRAKIVDVAWLGESRETHARRLRRWDDGGARALSPLPANRATKMNADVGSKSGPVGTASLGGRRASADGRGGVYGARRRLGRRAETATRRRGGHVARRSQVWRRARRAPFIPRTRHLNRHPGRIRRGRLPRRRRRVKERVGERARAAVDAGVAAAFPSEALGGVPNGVPSGVPYPRPEARSAAALDGGDATTSTSTSDRGRRNDPRRRGRSSRRRCLGDPSPLPQHPPPLPRHPTARLRRSSATPSPRSSTRWRLDGAARRGSASASVAASSARSTPGPARVVPLLFG